MTLIIYDNESEDMNMRPLFFPHQSRGVEHLQFIWENPRFILFEATEAEALSLIGKDLVQF